LIPFSGSPQLGSIWVQLVYPRLFAPPCEHRQERMQINLACDFRRGMTEQCLHNSTGFVDLQVSQT
jgi:hypothetical protein